MTKNFPKLMDVTKPHIQETQRTLSKIKTPASLPSYIIFKQCVCVCVLSHEIMSNSSLPGSSVYGIFQAWLLKQVAISSSRGSPSSGMELVSPVSAALAGRFFTTELLGKKLKTIAHLPKYIIFKALP